MPDRQRALITGGGTGIGAALAQHLAARGLDIVVSGRRRSMLEAVRAEQPDRIAIASADLADPAGRDNVAAALGERRLDFVVHAAGVLEPVAPIGAIDGDALRGHLAINLETPLLLTQRLLDRLGKGTRLLLISSGAAHHPREGWAAYCTSKAALSMLAECLNLELNRHGILCATARPGVVETPMQTALRDIPKTRFPRVERFRDLYARGELRHPAEVARFLGWLLLECGPGAYPSRAWNIDDPDHQPLWREDACT